MPADCPIVHVALVILASTLLSATLLVLGAGHSLGS